MSYFHIGAYLEISAPPQQASRHFRGCPVKGCQVSYPIEKDIHFCGVHGARLIDLPPEMRPARYFDFVNEDICPQFVDELRELHVPDAPENTFYVVTNMIHGDDIFCGTFGQILPHHMSKMVQAFRDQHAKLHDYLIDKMNSGLISSISIKFGFLQYFD